MSLFEMTKMVIRSLTGKPATLMYPARPQKKMPVTRGHVEIDKERCILCRSCQRVCPTHAICVEVKEKTWQIDRLRCKICNACVEVCPTKCLIMDPVYPKALTSRDQRLYKTEVAGPKKKEPSTGVEKPVKEPVKASEGAPAKE